MDVYLCLEKKEKESLIPVLGGNNSITVCKLPASTVNLIFENSSDSIDEMDNGTKTAGIVLKSCMMASSHAHGAGRSDIMCV